jgi:hypothetical protein
MDKDIYYASDKDIFDALASKRKFFSVSVLTELCNDRGIFVSKDDEREQLIDYISTLPHSVQDLQYILDHVQANSRAERKTSTKLIGEKIKDSNLTEAIDELRDCRSTKYNERYETVTTSENKVVVDIDYQDIDFGATRLKQKQEKTARIEIQKNEDGSVLIRHSANERVDSITQELVKSIRTTIKDEKKESDFQQKIVDLNEIKDAELRTRFFTDLIKALNGLTLEEVSSISVASFNSDDDEDEVDELKQEVLGKLQSAILKGENLLETPEYKNFRSNGFYISGIRWKSRTAKGDKIVFVCSFEDADKCIGLEYDVKGKFEFKDEDYLKTLKPIEGIEKDELLSNLENTALTVYDTIVDIYKSQKEEKNESI